MTSFLAGLLRSLFPALALALGLIVLGGAGLYGLISGHMLSAVVFGIAGLIVVVVLLGMMALQIETHALLTRTTSRTEPDPMEPEAPQRAATLGRREPVVTLRPQVTYEAI